MTFLARFFVVLAVLKCGGEIQMPWPWVLAPLWVGCVLRCLEWAEARVAARAAALRCALRETAATVAYMQTRRPS